MVWGGQNGEAGGVIVRVDWIPRIMLLPGTWFFLDLSTVSDSLLGIWLPNV